MTEQESRDWSQFASKVVDLIENETVEKSCNIPIANWTVEQCLGKLRAAVDSATVRQDSIESQQYEMIRAAYFAQLAYAKLKDNTFNTKQAVEFLEQCKAVRPAHEPRLVVLSQCFGKALSRFIDRNYSLLDDMPSLPFKNHFIVVYPSGEARLTRDLPAYAEWVIASEDEIRQAVGKAKKTK